MVDLLPPWPQFGVFLGAVIVLGVTPGPGVFYILATSIAQGARSGLVSVLGIAAGTFVHVLLAVFGLTLLLASSPVFFQFVKYAGAAYLIALGVYLVIQRGVRQETRQAQSSRETWRIFMQAVMVNVLNPKVGIFFLAFSPVCRPCTGRSRSTVFSSWRAAYRGDLRDRYAVCPRGGDRGRLSQGSR